MLVFLTAADDSVFREQVQARLKKIHAGVKFRKITFKGSLYVPSEGEVCLCMGEDVVRCAQKEGLLPKNKKLGRFREHPLKSSKGGHWLFTHAPEDLFSDVTKTPELHWDLVLADRLERKGSTSAVIGEYEYVQHFGETVQYIKDKYEATGKKVTVALDTETMGLNPFDPEKKIVCIQITVAKGQAQVAYILNTGGKRLALIKKQLNWILNTDTVNVVGANLKYDLLWFRSKLGLTCSNFFFDTLLAGSLLDENRSNSLSNHVKEYVPDLGGYDTFLNESYDKGEMDKIPKEDLLVYAGGDTDGDYQVANIMRREFKKQPRLQNFYFKLLHPAGRAFEEIEYNGMVVDTERCAAARTTIKAEEDRCRKELLEILPRKLKAKYQDKENILTPAVIAEYLFTPYGLNLRPKQFTPKTRDLPVEKRKPSTSRDHFMMFSGHEEAAHFIGLYRSWLGCGKAVSTYIDGFLTHLREDGKFHPTHALFRGGAFEDSKDTQAGTVTGRISVKNPGTQLIPKHLHKNPWAKLLRSCYVAPEGYKVAQLDFSQGELRVIACLADEDTMLQAYKDGVDLHALTGATLSGHTLEEVLSFEKTDKDLFDKIRLGAKGANFGKIYNQQPRSYVDYARMNYGLHLTMQESEEIHEKFFKTYPYLTAYHNRQIRYVHQHQCAVSPLGRVRHLPMIKSPLWGVKSKAERLAINAPVQSTLSDMCLWAISFITQKYSKKDVWIATMIHDSIMLYVRDDRAEDILRDMKYIMENLPLEKEFGWKPQIDFPVDAEIGDDLAGLKKIKL